MTSADADTRTVSAKDPERRPGNHQLAFGGPDNRDIFLEGAISGTFWHFKAPFRGLIGPGGVRLPRQP